eukprot:1448915-Pyramimonas_sp.AAC.1
MLYLSLWLSYRAIKWNAEAAQHKDTEGVKRVLGLVVGMIQPSDTFASRYTGAGSNIPCHSALPRLGHVPVRPSTGNKRQLLAE